MSFYGIRDNKCRIDLNDRTINFLHDVPYSATLESIIENVDVLTDGNGLAMYCISDVNNTNIYPVTVPENDAAIVIINKVDNSAIISFHFYDSFYINYYSNRRLAGWIKVGKTTDFTLTCNIDARSTTMVSQSLSQYGLTGRHHAIVTPLDSIGFVNNQRSIDYTYFIRDNMSFVLQVKNNLSTAITGVRFNVCII